MYNALRRLSKAKVQKKGDKYTTNEHFSVSQISYNDNREIISLVIKDSKGIVVYSLQPDNSLREMPERGRNLSDTEVVLLMAELNRTGVNIDTVLDRYGLNDIRQMTAEIYDKAMGSLKKSKSKVA